MNTISDKQFSHQRFTGLWAKLPDMGKDIIVEEIRKIREEHAKKFNYDIKEICIVLQTITNNMQYSAINIKNILRYIARSCISLTIYKKAF